MKTRFFCKWVVLFALLLLNVLPMKARWNAVPEEMRNDYIRLGEQYLNSAWEAIPDSVFAEFRTNGNRTRYEVASFGIRTQFACLVMAEMMEGKARFVPSICQGLHYFLEKEPWWGIPAHYPKAKPLHDVQPVDLFNAETSSMLAWTLYMLGTEIDRQEEGLSDAVRKEIEYRFLTPTLNEPQGWKHNANNWNTWITSNWLACVLICERDAAKRGAAIRGIHDDLRLFLKGYPDDGACEEGVAYWDRAGASFFESLYLLEEADKLQRKRLGLADGQKERLADGQNYGQEDNWLKGLLCTSSDSIHYLLDLTPKEKEKVHRMGQYLTTMHIHDLHFVNYSDAASFCVPNINILFPFGMYEQDENMMQLAAYVGRKYDYLKKPSTLFLQSGNFPTLGRELMLLSMLPQFIQTKAVQPRTQEAYLQNSQILVASNADWFVSMKGGNNAESHNHNDLGNFVIYYLNQPVIIDLGRDTYTSQSFSNRRFELMNCRSAYHNVPLINGFEQKDGRGYRTSNVEHISGGGISSFGFNIENAYPKETDVTKWERVLTFDGRETAEETVKVHEIFEYAKGNAATQLVLMCYGEPRFDKKKNVLLADGKVRLCIGKSKASKSERSLSKSDVHVSWEKVNMPDGIMKTQWNDNVYRIFLTLKQGKKYCKGSLVYAFEKAE